MASTPARSATADAIVSLCHRGHPPERLKAEVLARLRRVVPIDALWWATSDPATLLFTSALREGIPDRTIPYFVDNEFAGADVNRWTDLAQHPAGVSTLADATGGRLDGSARYRDVFRPLGLGDELRAVLRTGDSCWGLMCLHRAAGRAFSAEEAQLIRRLAPHLAEGIRAGLLRAGTVAAPAADAVEVVDAPGLVILDAAGEVIAVTAAAQAWFDELGHDVHSGHQVPPDVGTVAALLRRSVGAVPRLRVRTRAGRWLVLHASWLSTAAADQIAVIIEPATPAEVAAVIMRAYGFTERERSVTGLVCQGRSTAQIAAELWISANTVQDHLKSVFDKAGVRSRRELMATILREHYLPGLSQARPIGPTGFFA